MPVSEMETEIKEIFIVLGEMEIFECLPSRRCLKWRVNMTFRKCGVPLLED